MAEYINAAAQVVTVGQNVIFTASPVRCTRGNIVHREGSGLFTLRGQTGQCRALYRVGFGANIAVPTGETVGPISLAIAIEGEPLASATMIQTPAAVDQYANVYAETSVSVPRGCCVTVSVKNAGATPVSVQNANLTIERTA